MNNNITVLNKLKVSIKHSSDNNSIKRRMEIQSILLNIKSICNDLRCETIVNYGSIKITINQHSDINSIIEKWFP